MHFIDLALAAVMVNPHALCGGEKRCLRASRCQGRLWGREAPAHGEVPVGLLDGCSMIHIFLQVGQDGTSTACVGNLGDRAGHTEQRTCQSQAICWM